MDPTQTSHAILSPWQEYGVVGSVVVALGFSVAFLILWIRSLVSKEIERLQAEIVQKEQAYDRLVEATRRREKDSP
jgi:hypothetical protein